QQGSKRELLAETNEINITSGLSIFSWKHSLRLLVRPLPDSEAQFHGTTSLTQRFWHNSVYSCTLLCSKQRDERRCLYCRGRTACTAWTVDFGVAFEFQAQARSCRRSGAVARVDVPHFRAGT